MKRLPHLSPNECVLLTAARLLDGRIVWRGQDGQWFDHVAQAACLTAEESEVALEEASTQAARQGVMGVYPVVACKGAPPQPVSMKEHIRAFGPTVHPEFSYVPQSEASS